MESNTTVNVPKYTQIICDYCARIHTLPVNPPTKLCVYERDGWDNQYVPPLEAVNDDEDVSVDLWMEDLFLKKQIREFHTKYNDEVVIDDEDVERALYRLFGRRYKRVGSNELGEIWVQWSGRKYIRIYVWMCPSHTMGAYQIWRVVLEMHQEMYINRWKPCACTDSLYIPVADLSMQCKLLYTYTDEITKKLNISVEQLTKLENEILEKRKRRSTNGWVLANIRAGIVWKIASGQMVI